MKLFEKIKIRNHLFEVINQLEEENSRLKDKIKEQEHNNIILIDNEMELRSKIKDLENNIEFLIKNLSPKKKKEIGLQLYNPKNQILKMQKGIFRLYQRKGRKSNGITV